jgi:hypothetical protein
MRNLIFITFTLLSNLSLSQYPSWFPNEFKNKVFCGEFDTWGKMIGGTTSFITVPYEISISEDGIQIRMNPGSQFGRDEWGETIKVKFNTSSVWQSPEFSFWKRYIIDLSSSNETKDSPLHPMYDLEALTISVSNYNNQPLTRDQQRNFDAYPVRSSWIEFSVNVPYYESSGPGKGTWPKATVCGTIKTKKEITDEKLVQQKLAAEQKILAEEAAIVEKSKYLEIDKLMSQGKIEDANAMLKTLSQPEFYPNKSKLEQSFAPIQLKNIEAILVRNNIDSAIILYNSMPESVAEKTTAEKKIQYELNTYYKTNGIPITQAAWDDIWDKGKSKLEKLPIGEYKLEVLSTGEVRINGIYSGFSIIWGLPKEKRHKLNQRFKYVEIQQSTLTIKKDERIESQIFYANCTKQIAKNNTTNEYRLIKGGKHETNETIVAYKQDINLEKNHYRIIGKVKISKLLIVKVEGKEISIELNSLLDERTLNQGLLIK